MKDATIQDIADEARVSKSTVSRVLNNTTAVNPLKREAVLAATKRLGFRPNAVAKSLASGRSMTIGVLTQSIGSPLYDGIAQGIVTALGDTPYSPVFVDGQWEPDTEIQGIQALISRRVDGLIAIGGHLSSNDLAQLTGDAPTVVVARVLPAEQHHCIFVDNVDGGYQATKHLIDLGHRDIAMICGIANHADAIDRLSGYKKALAEANIEIRPELILDGDFNAASGHAAIENLCKQNIPFTAVFASNDQMAFGARLAFHRTGLRVPEDVSIIGFDDQAASEFMVPPLTTVAQPSQEMGASASEAIIDLINRKTLQPKQFVVQLQPRESTAVHRG